MIFLVSLPGSFDVIKKKATTCMIFFMSFLQSFDATERKVIDSWCHIYKTSMQLKGKCQKVDNSQGTRLKLENPNPVKDMHIRMYTSEP